MAAAMWLTALTLAMGPINGWADSESPLEILAERDPLSCMIYGTNSKLCNGPAGAWQLGRLALSVEASAKALELAGIGYEAKDVQAMIFRDGATNGLDLALVTPTVALLDLSTLGPNGPLGKNATEIYGLAALSLESLYPDMASRLGHTRLNDLPGAVSISGFRDFQSHAKFLSGPINNQSSFGFESFMPVRHKSLANSEPILKLIPGLPVGAGLGKPAIGFSPNDFVFTHKAEPKSPSMAPNGPFGGLPLSMAYTESLSMPSSTNGDVHPSMPNLGSAPFGGRGSLFGGRMQPGTVDKTPNFRSQLVTKKGPGEGGKKIGFGGQFLDSFSIHGRSLMSSEARSGGHTSDQFASNRVVSKSFSTCRDNSDKVSSGTFQTVRGYITMAGGVFSLGYGLKKGKTPYIAAGLTAIGLGLVDTMEGTEKWAKGITACISETRDKKKNNNSKGNGQGTSDTTPKTKEKEPEKKKKPQVGKKPEKKKKPKEKEKPDQEVKPKASPSTTKTTMPAEAPGGTPGRESTMPPPAVKGSPRRVPYKCDPRSMATIDYCEGPIYKANEFPCMADRNGEVGCFAPNTFVRSVFAEGPLFMATKVDGVDQMLKLEGIREDHLFGDLVQAAIVSSLDPDRFDLATFIPVHDGGTAARTIDELLQAQPNQFFENGFGRDLGIGIDEQGKLELPTTEGLIRAEIIHGDFKISDEPDGRLIPPASLSP